MSITRLAALVTLATPILFLPDQAASAGGGAEQQANSLTLAEFQKLHTALQPPKDELWRSIPWHVSILEGRDLAAKTKKPIFVWVASGEPLGCG